MSLINFSCLCMFIVFAQLTESRLLVLRDYDDEPLVLGHVDRSGAEEEKHIKYQAIDSHYRPKRTHSKKAVLQYGRHIYFLDNFANLKDLRSKMAHLKPNSISYSDYVDNLFQSSDSAKQSEGDYTKDLFIFSNTPVQFCDGDQCDKDLRKFSKHKNYEDDRKHKIMQLGRMKRFQIVDNRHKSKKPQSDSSEEHHKKKKQKASKKNKKKHSFETAESESKESGSEEKSSGSHKKKKKKHEPKKSSEESVDIKRKQKKKHNDDNSADGSVEKWKKHDKDSKSKADFHKKKKKTKKFFGKSDETKRKTFAVEDDFFMQGNRMFHTVEGKSKKKHYDFDKRRRLEHFLPKRYHWDSSDIHDLGYYWFNGPKGRYSEPRQL